MIPSKPQRPGVRALPRLARLGARLRRAYRGQVHALAPAGLVLLNDRSKGLVDRTEALAEEGREDEGARLELRQLAGRHVRDLRAAAFSFKQEDRDRESRVADRARRLPEAAAGDGPVSEVSDATERVLAEFDRWWELDNASCFSVLAEREPRLSDLEDEIRSGRACRDD